MSYTQYSLSKVTLNPKALSPSTVSIKVLFFGISGTP